MIVLMSCHEAPSQILDRVQWRLLLMAIGMLLIGHGTEWTWDGGLDLYASVSKSIEWIQSEIENNGLIGVLSLAQAMWYGSVWWFATGVLTLLIGIWMLRTNGSFVHRIVWRITD